MVYFISVLMVSKYRDILEPHNDKRHAQRSQSVRSTGDHLNPHISLLQDWTQRICRTNTHAFCVLSSGLMVFILFFLQRVFSLILRTVYLPIVGTSVLKMGRPQSSPRHIPAQMLYPKPCLLCPLKSGEVKMSMIETVKEKMLTSRIFWEVSLVHPLMKS